MKIFKMISKLYSPPPKDYEYKGKKHFCAFE